MVLGDANSIGMLKEETTECGKRRSDETRVRQKCLLMRLSVERYSSSPRLHAQQLSTGVTARFFAQHLPEFGWKPIVLAADLRYYEWTVDPEMKSCWTLHWSNPDARFALKWTRKLGFGDLGLRTLWHHWRALSRICHQRRVDLIFISVPQHSHCSGAAGAYALWDSVHPRLQ
jgi:hypothetical protein